MSKIKIYVITLSKTFMKGHSKAGQQTGFKEKFLSGEKLYTIRGNYLLWAKRIKDVKDGIAIISIRQWEDKPYRSKQIEIGKITKENSPGVQRVFITYSGHLGYEASVCGHELFGYNERELLSKNDGLSIWDFSEWFFDGGKVDEFSGAIIHFTKFRY